MNNENKDLLLIDLLARLPHGVKIRLGDYDYQVCGYNSEKEMPLKIWLYYDSNLTLKSYIDVYLTDYRPYLRSMSSMTKEEKEILKSKCFHTETEEDWEGIKCDSWGIEILNKYDTKRWDNTIYVSSLINMDAIDWLNAHHFDYRNLIKKGLALEAPDGMYKVEEQQ